MTQLIPDVEVQTRANDGEIRFFASVKKAFAYADRHPEVWKISWTDHGTLERIRMVRSESGWVYEDLMDSVAEELKPELNHNIFQAKVEPHNINLKQTRKPY